MIQVTEKALKELNRIKTHDNRPPNTNLRIRVAAGGCSGMSYEMDFTAEAPSPQDKIFEFAEIKILVDPKSFLFVQNVTLDFSDGLQGKGFQFSNPNAKRTCGCGESFST